MQESCIHLHEEHRVCTGYKLPMSMSAGFAECVACRFARVERRREDRQTLILTLKLRNSVQRLDVCVFVRDNTQVCLSDN